ncbi:glutaredoxin 3 [Snodgrassella communis]|uniref:glutaredoxin 3 n=1 Tax=Snodgrassella communis TaxID=2946699 RepID=UPI000C1F8512|nr:glutaredoxin 3 [Snodgrassella communis]PIT10516.1 glutaredoxin 3 [Snodgrassella communis]
MQLITIYTTGVCPYCQMAKTLLKQKGVTDTDINEIRIDTDPQTREQMMQRTGRRTVPQIYIGEVHVGGFDDLNALNQAGKLDALLAG